MPIKSGYYIITNIRQRNLVSLRDPNDGTPLVAGVKKDIPYEKWFVELYSNGTYSIRNVMHDKSFANAGNRAELGAVVEGRNDEQYWSIQATRNERRYTICSIDTGLFWALEDRQVGTPITLLGSAADQRCWWTFEDAETGAAAEIDKKPRNILSKWTNTALRAVFSPLKKNRRKGNPEFTISDLPSSSQPEIDITNTNPITAGDFSSNQPELDVTTLDPAIPDPLSSSQPPPDAEIILLDIPFKISESNGLLDPLTSISEALEKVLSAAEIPFEFKEFEEEPDEELGEESDEGLNEESDEESDGELDDRSYKEPYEELDEESDVESDEKSDEEVNEKSDEEVNEKSDEEVNEKSDEIPDEKPEDNPEEKWKRPFRRLVFHLHTIKYHRLELEKDFKIDSIVPSPESTIIRPLEKYAKGLRNIYQVICNGIPAHSSITNIDPEKAPEEGSIKQRIDHMDSAFEEYTTALHSFADQTYKNMQKLPLVEQNFLVKAEDTHHKFSKRPNAYGVQHKECLPGTREKTTQAIREWANSTSGTRPTFLLLDVAGSGKSTVAKTMAEELGHTRLVARYFFSRDTEMTRSTDSFCSTVADEFIACNSALEEPVKLFKKRPNFDHLPFKDLFNGLVIGPLEKLSLDAILIIDALDECNDEDDSCTDLLDAICSHRVSTPRLRILATGRPELHITRWAHKYKVAWHNFFRLEGSNKDVDFYIEQSLQEFPGIHDTVMSLANGVFIWARIACDLILKTADVNRLLEELGTAVSLDYLYQVALNQSIPKDEGSRRVFAVVLQMILASREPLSIAELEKLAPEPFIAEQIVTRLGALLVYQGRQDPIRLLHATFREFLTTPPKAGRYSIQIELGHHTLTLGCIKAIEDQSAQKFFPLPDLDTISRREEIFIRDEIYIDRVSRIYTYSSTSWVHHCIASYRKPAMDPQILEFAQTHLRMWAYNADEWKDLDTISCLRNVLLLSHGTILPEITETVVDQSLESVGLDNEYFLIETNISCSRYNW